MKSKYFNYLFSKFLNEEQLKRVSLRTYFFTLEEEDSRGRYWRLLPSDHANAYPLQVRMDDKLSIEVGELNFYTEVIYREYVLNKALPVEKIKNDTKLTKHKKALVVNLLDNCFGHTFLKLYNLLPIWKEFSDTYDIVTLVPAAVSHFLPADKGLRIIELNIGFTDAMNCYSLDTVLMPLRDQYEEVDFVAMDTFKYLPFNRQEIVSFFNFFGNSKLENVPTNICFFYRKDYFRTWNGNRQQRNIEELFTLLRAYFDSSVQFYVLGEKDNHKFSSWIVDARVDNYSSESDYLYNSLFSKSIISIGVMGSAMTQSSLFAPCSVYLVPHHKTSVVAQDLPQREVNNIVGYFENIYLFGNARLSDVNPVNLRDRIMMLYYTGMGNAYKSTSMQQLVEEGSVSNQQSFIERKYPFVKIEAIKRLKEEINSRSIKKILPWYLISKFLKKFT